MEMVSRAAQRSRWTLATRGIILLVLGFILLILPNITLTVVIVLFGIAALLDGILTVTNVVKKPREGRPDTRTKTQKGYDIVRGVVLVILGIFALISPTVIGQIFLYIIAAWAIIVGVIEAFVTLQQRGNVQGGWLRLLLGVLSIAFGGLLFYRMDQGLQSLVWLIGGFGIIIGIIMIVCAFSSRSPRAVTA